METYGSHNKVAKYYFNSILIWDLITRNFTQWEPRHTMLMNSLRFKIDFISCNTSLLCELVYEYY
jgi:hypothetical protein